MSDTSLLLSLSKLIYKLSSSAAPNLDLRFISLNVSSRFNGKIEAFYGIVKSTINRRAMRLGLGIDFVRLLTSFLSRSVSLFVTSNFRVGAIRSSRSHLSPRNLLINNDSYVRSNFKALNRERGHHVGAIFQDQRSIGGIRSEKVPTLVPIPTWHV